MNHHTVSSEGFRGVQRRIGRRDPFGHGANGHVWDVRNAHAGGHPHDSLIRFKCLTFNLLAEPLRQHQSSVKIGMGKDDPEFFPSVSADRIDVANRPTHQGRCGLEHLISCEMTELVVDHLEVVHVHEDETGR